LITACGSANKNNSGSEDNNKEAAAGDLREKDLVKLNIVMMSTNKDDKDEVIEAINKITREKLNIEVDITFIAYGNYVQQTTMMLSSGKGVDILPVYMTPLATVANNG